MKNSRSLNKQTCATPQRNLNQKVGGQTLQDYGNRPSLVPRRRQASFAPKQEFQAETISAESRRPRFDGRVSHQTESSFHPLQAPEMSCGETRDSNHLWLPARKPWNRWKGSRCWEIFASRLGRGSPLIIPRSSELRISPGRPGNCVTDVGVNDDLNA